GSAGLGDIEHRREAGGGVDGPGAVVVLLDFEREFAATSGAGVLLDGGEKEPSDAGATIGGQDEEVVDIDERSGSESGKAAEADGETNGFRSAVSEEDGGGGVLTQTG